MQFNPSEITMEEFERIFPTDASARLFFERIRWGEHPICPHCGSFKSYSITDGRQYKCASCKKKYSLAINSLLNYSQISLRKWLMAVFVYQKSRRQILSIGLSAIIDVTADTAYAMKKRLEMIFEPIDRDNKTGFEIFKEACANFFNLKDKYIPRISFNKSFYHIEGEMELADRDTYDRLLLYTKRRLFYCNFISVSFLSPEEILSEVFIRLADHKEKRTDGQFIVKLINRTISSLWYDYQKTNPSLIEQLREYQKEWKQEGRANLRNWYISQLESDRLNKIGIEITPSEIRADNTIMAEVKDRIKQKRANDINSDFISHI